MDNVKVKALLKGIVVVIDDEISRYGADISKLVRKIEENNIPVLSYNKIPTSEYAGALYNASIIILDWRFDSQNEAIFYASERPYGGEELRENSQKEVIQFIRNVYENLFVPIFIFTNENIEVVQDTLKENNFEITEKDRIFIEAKDNITDVDALYRRIGNWMDEKPSAYVLKEWDRAFCKSRNEMFLNMYSISHEWVRIMWDMIENDTGGENASCHREFRDFLTRSIVNRLSDIRFDTSCLQSNGIKVSDDAIMKILEAERYITYGEDYLQVDNSPHTGDLFQKEGKYYLNIRAECDLARKSKVDLYCLKGDEIDETNITLDDIHITDDNKLMIASQAYELANESADNIKSALVGYNKKRILHFGSIIEKANEVIIPCVAGKKVLRFNLDIVVKKFSEMKTYLQGRLLPPYITRVQQRCAHYIVRTGTLPIPPDLFVPEQAV